MTKKINKKGFTLAELLVVVAIIAVLVAVSIPIFTAQLNKARLATNQANARAAKAEAIAEYLTKTGVTEDTTYTYVYNAKEGTGAEGAKVGNTVMNTDETPAKSTVIEDWTVDYTVGEVKLGSKTFDTWSVVVGKDGVTEFAAK